MVGTVGSGKSSLLSAILEDIACVVGSITLRGSGGSPKVAYVSQAGWVFNATFERNVAQGDEPIDREWYNRVLKACQQTEDVANLPLRHSTELGKRGIPPPPFCRTNTVDPIALITLRTRTTLTTLKRSQSIIGLSFDRYEFVRRGAAIAFGVGHYRAV
jgi:hypothetical protein